VSGKESIAASARAILDFPKGGLSGVKGLIAMLTNRHTTIVTCLCGTRARKKIFSALGTSDSGHDNWQRLGHLKFGMTAPEFQFNQAMTIPAERKQVRKIICVPVIIKQTKGSNVVNNQIRLLAAVLASVIISLRRLAALRFPVWPSVPAVTAEPSDIVCTGKTNRSPSVFTICTTEIPVMYRTRNSLYFFIASGAMHSNSLAPYALAMSFLPFPITNETAKMVNRLAAHIRLCFVHFVALVASECNHVCIIHYTRTLCNG
jgi:hypothetical protein